MAAGIHKLGKERGVSPVHITSIQFLFGGSVFEILGSHHPHSLVVIKLVVAVIKSLLLGIVAFRVFNFFVRIEVVL